MEIPEIFKKYERFGKTIVLYRTGVANISFLILDEPHLTTILKQSINPNVPFAKYSRLLDKICKLLEESPKVSEKQLMNIHKELLISEYHIQDSVSKLAATCQRLYKKTPRVTIKVLTKPTIMVQATMKLPTGKIYVGLGKNKSQAKQEAANKALNEYWDL